MHILSMVSHRDKAPTNALIAQAVRSCADRSIPHLVYGELLLRPQATGQPGVTSKAQRVSESRPAEVLRAADDARSSRVPGRIPSQADSTVFPRAWWPEPGGFALTGTHGGGDSWGTPCRRAPSGGQVRRMSLPAPGAAGDGSGLAGRLRGIAATVLGLSSSEDVHPNARHPHIQERLHPHYRRDGLHRSVRGREPALPRFHEPPVPREAVGRCDEAPVARGGTRKRRVPADLSGATCWSARTAPLRRETPGS